MSDFPNMMAALDAIDDGGSLWTAMIAALGDEPLFRRATAAEESTNNHDVYGPFVQVWLEDDLPSAGDVYGILKEERHE